MAIIVWGNCVGTLIVEWLSSSRILVHVFCDKYYLHIYYTFKISHMKKYILLFIMIILKLQIISAQNFLDSYNRFSRKADAIVILTNGEEIKAPIDRLKLSKGLIQEVTVKQAGKKRVLKVSEIKNIYAKPSGLEKLGVVHKVGITPRKWNDDRSMHATYVKEGYVFYEQVTVLANKKRETFLLQLLNPGFANGIKIYTDPRASQSASVDVAGLTGAGDNAKSYYVKKGDEVAFRLYRKNYDDEFGHLYGDCKAFVKEFPKENGWHNIE